MFCHPSHKWVYLFNRDFFTPEKLLSVAHLDKSEEGIHVIINSSPASKAKLAFHDGVSSSTTISRHPCLITSLAHLLSRASSVTNEITCHCRGLRCRCRSHPHFLFHLRCCRRYFPAVDLTAQVKNHHRHLPAQTLPGSLTHQLEVKEYSRICCPVTWEEPHRCSVHRFWRRSCPTTSTSCRIVPEHFSDGRTRAGHQV